MSVNPDTLASNDPNAPQTSDAGVSVQVGDLVIYHDAAGDMPALVLALAGTVATLQEFSTAGAPGVPLTSIALGNATGQWEPRQAKYGGSPADYRGLSDN